MNTTSPPVDENPADQILRVFTILQNKIGDLERQIETLNQRATAQDQSVAELRLWHNSRLFGRISKIFPKSRRVVFYHPHFFADNIKYAYLRFLDIAAAEGIDCSFLTNNDATRALLIKNGLPCMPPASTWDMTQYQELLQTKVLVVQDDFAPFNWEPNLTSFLLHGAKLVQLWHGIPMKELGLLYKKNTRGKDVSMAATGPADILVAPGLAMKEDWRRWVAYRQFAAVGYPRNDVMLRETVPHDLLNVDAPTLQALHKAHTAGQKVVFYMPTFRDGGGLGWLKHAGIDRISAWCADKGVHLFIKPHPVDQEAFAELATSRASIHLVPPSSDAYPLLRYADALMTDYSSLAFDYLLLDRPILYFRPDHVAYIQTCRAMLPDWERFTVGPVAADADALCTAMDKALWQGDDDFKTARRALRKELFDHQDAQAADRVSDLILGLVNTSQEMPADWTP